MHLPHRSVSWPNPAQPKQLFDQLVSSGRKWLPRQNTIKSKHPARQKSGKDPHQPKPRSRGKCWAASAISPPPVATVLFASPLPQPRRAAALCYPRGPEARESTRAVLSEHRHCCASLPAVRVTSVISTSCPAWIHTASLSLCSLSLYSRQQPACSANLAWTFPPPPGL